VQAALGWLFAAAIALVAPTILVLPRYARLERGTIWGVVLLIGMAGWGGLVAQLAFPDRKTDLGLRLGWGAAAMVAAGGFLCVLSLGTAPVLATLVLGGVALSLAAAVRARATLGARIIAWLRLWSPVAIFGFLALAILISVYFLGGASGALLNGNDDQAAYLVFVRKILASGTLIDPFSMRRITAYGGQSFLQALTTVGAASPLQATLLDLGVSLVIAFALVVGAGRDRRSVIMRSLLVLPALVVVTVPNIRLNTGSAMSGVFMFLSLYRTAASVNFRRRSLASAALLGLLAAVACTLRQSYLVPVAVFLVVLYLPAARRSLYAEDESRREQLRAIIIAGGTLLVLLIPWAVMSYRSNRTFLFPAVAGNYRAEYGGFTTDASFTSRIKLCWDNIVYCHPIHSIPFFLLAGGLIPWRRTNGALPALLWASFIGFVAVVYSLPLSDAPNIARYYYGFTVPTFLAVMLAAFARSWRWPSGHVRMRAAVPAVIAVVAAVAQIEESRGSINQDINYLSRHITAARAHPSSLEDQGAPYRELQAAIPAGASMLVMLDDPFWLNFRRNRIDLIDLPGAASPAPGMPLDDDEKLASYLHGLGYRYLSFVRPSASKSLYRRDHWTKMLTKPTQPIWGMSAPFYLNTFDRLEGLAKSRIHLYDDGVMVALDLEARERRDKK
jgi:hypothetical protein